MKNLQTYFFESSKLFEFKIKLANYEATPECIERIKNAVDAYCVETISKPKRLPIQEHRDFGKLGPCECEVIDIAVCYPVIAEQVRQLVINRAGIPASNVCVYTKDQYLQEEGVEQLIISQGEGGPIIENPELPDVPGAQDLAGPGRLTSLLKELETRKYEFVQDSNEAGKTTNDAPTGDVSPVGTHKNKIPSPVKGQ